jgi:hypothetical protein
LILSQLIQLRILLLIALTRITSPSSGTALLGLTTMRSVVQDQPPDLAMVAILERLTQAQERQKVQMQRQPQDTTAAFAQRQQLEFQRQQFEMQRQ